MKRVTFVLGVLAAAVAGSMTFAASAATEKATGATPSSAAAASAAPAGAAPAATPATSPTPAGTTQGTGKAKDAAAPAKAAAAPAKDAATPGKDAPRGHGAGDTASLLTPDERSAHTAAMQKLKSFEECTAYVAKYDKLLADRAKEKGVAVPARRGNTCERMQARGFNP